LIRDFDLRHSSEAPHPPALDNSDGENLDSQPQFFAIQYLICRRLCGIFFALALTFVKISSFASCLLTIDPINTLISLAVLCLSASGSSEGVQRSSSPIEAVSIRKRCANSAQKSTVPTGKCTQRTQVKIVNHIPVIKAVRINPATPAKEAVNL